MARSRLEFQQALRSVRTGIKAWYIRPQNNRMTYPCFVYKSVAPKQVSANNHGYFLYPGYEVLFISENEDEAIIPEMLEKFPHCSAGAPYISDDLHHYPFTIYY